MLVGIMTSLFLILNKSPITILTGTLNLDKESKRNRIKEGYNDTKILLEPIMLVANFQREKEIQDQASRLFFL